MELHYSLPKWFDNIFPEIDRKYESTVDRMKLVLNLAQRNIEENTGGPFAAAIFERESGQLIAPGINIVTSANCSVLHAEIVAIMLAQKKSVHMI